MEYRKGVEYLKKVDGVSALWVLNDNGIRKIKRFGEIKILDSIYTTTD